MSNKQILGFENLLYSFAEAGNVEALAIMMAKNEMRGLLFKQSKNGNTFLHAFAQRYNLKNLFRKMDSEDRRLIECFQVQNKKGYTFLAVAVNSVKGDRGDRCRDREEDIVEALPPHPLSLAPSSSPTPLSSSPPRFW